MRLTFPHSLGRGEARDRIRAREDEIAGMLPAFARVRTQWSGDDRMELFVDAMGKSITGAVEVDDLTVTFEFELPAALSFAEPMIQAAIEPKARKLLG